MTKAEKTAVIEELADIFKNQDYFYITDSSQLDAEQTSALRRLCFEKGVQLRVLKNTLVKKALESVSDKQFEGLYGTLSGPTAIMFTEVSNMPAKIIKEFRKQNPKPEIKAAYIDSAIYIGHDQLDTLSSLKSKEEMLGEIVTLLQSPIKNVLGSLQSGGNTLSGLLKTLSEREG